MANNLPMIINKYDDSNTGTAAISGGTFSAEVPSDCLAEGYGVVLGSDGKYVVAAKPAETDTKTDGNNSGAVQATGNVDLDNSELLAQDALTAAAEVATVEVPTIEEGKESATAKIGGSTVEVNSAQATALKAVQDAAKDGSATVAVDLVVKADTDVAADTAIEESAKGSGAEVIPFKLSVDMVTTVKSGADVKATASVPVVETASAVKVTIVVDKASIADKRVSVARNHNSVVDILDADVNYETGAVTFSTDKFSDYAVLAVANNQSYDLKDYTNNDGAREAITNSNFNYSDEYAFAGWYKDSNFNEAYAASDKEGTAYPKFVKVSDLITFKGGSLRMDLTGSGDYTKTSLRFGYEMKVPDGATLVRDNWGWTWENPDGDLSGFTKAEKYWTTDDNGAIANLLLTPVYASGQKAGYTTNFKVTAQVAYVTADGTSVTACDKTQTRSVDQVATAIQSNQFASAEEKAYAAGILAN